MRKSSSFSPFVLLLMAGVVTLCLSSCKSNTATTRAMKGLSTRYNIYFNGREAYKKGVQGLEKSHDEEYSRRLLLHPVYGLVGKEPQSNADFERAIEKCKMAVQRRSITQKPKRRADNSPTYKDWMRRGEYNPFLHNAWLLSGRAQFYQGDFNAAVATFDYVERHFWWKPMAIAESRIMKARAYAVQGYLYDAESQLDLVIPHKQYANIGQLRSHATFRDMPRRLQREFCLCEAEILLGREATKRDAFPYLDVAKRGYMTREQRLRADFLMAQILEADGEGREAYRRYSRIVGRARDYKTQFNARIARTRVMPTGNSKRIERKLNRMRHQSRNADYLDQIHYALGNLALMRSDTTRALNQYELAIERSTRGGMDKAVAALALGELAFERADYVKAQQAYATVMGIIRKDDWTNYDEIARTSQVLDELQTHAETVELQDSLLHLASLGEQELAEVIDRLIADLRRREREADEAEALAAYENRRATQTDPLAQAMPQQPTVGQQDKSWYFYNPTQIAAGRAEFQRKWGARKPEDHWRRINKTETFFAEDDALVAADTAAHSLADASSAQAQAAAEATGDSLRTDLDAAAPTAIDDSLARDPHHPAYYLAQIPRTPEQQDLAHQLIEAGLYNMGVIINEKLENFPLAIHTFDRMATSYPESAYLPDAWYASYLMSMRMASSETLIERFGQNEPYYRAQAEVYRQKLLANFPESAYGVAVADPNYIETLRAMTAGQDDLYRQTYEAYLRSATDSVHQAYYFVHDRWPLSRLMPKFLFLHALSYVQEGDVDAFREALEQLTATYPESDVSPLAGLMVKGIREGRHVQLGQGVSRGLLWGSTLHREGDETAAPDSSLIFREGDNEPYTLLLAFEKDSLAFDTELPAGIRAENNLLFEIAKFNFENYLVRDFDLEIIDTPGGLSVLVISGFENLEQLLEYHDRMDLSESLALPSGITMIDISAANLRVLLAGRTFEDYFRWVEQIYGAESVIDAGEESTAAEEAREETAEAVPDSLEQ